MYHCITKILLYSCIFFLGSNIPAKTVKAASLRFETETAAFCIKAFAYNFYLKLKLTARVTRQRAF